MTNSLSFPLTPSLSPSLSLLPSSLNPLSLLSPHSQKNKHEIGQGYQDPIFFAVKHNLKKANKAWGKIRKRMFCVAKKIICF